MNANYDELKQLFEKPAADLSAILHRIDLRRIELDQVVCDTEAELARLDKLRTKVRAEINGPRPVKKAAAKKVAKTPAKKVAAKK